MMQPVQDSKARGQPSGSSISSQPAAALSLRLRLGLRQYAPPLALILLLLAAWQAATWLMRVPKWLLPSPLQIVVAGLEASALLGPHTWQTLQETWLGLALSLIVGLGLALVIDFSAMLRRTLYPLLVASQTVPILALAPLLIIWFGYGMLLKVIVVALVCFFPIVVSTADGLRVADPDLIALLRAMGANRRQIFFKVRVPGALPSFFSGLKIAITYSVVGAVIGEWVGASKGLGIFMIRSSKNFLTDRVFAAIAVTSLLSIIMFAAVLVLERALLPWYHAHREEVWEEM
jgi:ABC-type nitrate/sulfonate/bicarbonate transport system permease component